MSLDSDGTTSKYAPDFPDVVRAFLRPPVGGWGPTYSDEGAIEQALRKAYQAGRMDGVSSVLKPDAPRAVTPDGEPVEDEETFETVEEAWARLDLFEPATVCPGPVSAVLGTVTVEPLGDADPFEWAVAQARTVLGMSLAEATDYVRGVLG